MSQTPDEIFRHRISLRNVIGITLISVLFFVILGVIVVQLDPTIFAAGRDPVDMLLWFGLLLLASVMGATAYVVALRTPERWGVVGLRPVDKRWILIAIATGAVLFFVGERVDHAFDLGIMSSTREVLGSGLERQTALIGLLITMGVVFPVALEIYFRGVLFTYFRNIFGLETGIGLSALLYALLPIHLSPSIGIALFIIYGLIHGVVFAVLYERSGSLWTSIAAHGTLGALIVAKAAWI